MPRLLTGAGMRLYSAIGLDWHRMDRYNGDDAHFHDKKPEDGQLFTGTRKNHSLRAPPVDLPGAVPAQESLC